MMAQPSGIRYLLQGERHVAEDTGKVLRCLLLERVAMGAVGNACGRPSYSSDKQQEVVYRSHSASPFPEITIQHIYK
jgi:hypothetical protein